MSRDCEGKSCLYRQNKIKMSRRIRRRSTVPAPGITYDEIELITTNVPFQMEEFNMDSRGLSTDIDSEPDRSEPVWKIETAIEIEEVEEEVEELFPKKPTLWEQIMSEYEDKRFEYSKFFNMSKPFEPPMPTCSRLSAVQYLEKFIFPLLCPALSDTLFKAREWECLMIQKCRFSGLDYLSELLWNRNPRHPKRHKEYREIFDIPFTVIWLYYNPRPIYPLSWIWSTEDAIIMMQTYIRTYLVCKESDCSEMRQFWKTLKIEEEEEILAAREKYIEKIEIMFDEIFDKIIADAVFEAEWKIYGCRCVKKSCHCVCKCTRWCKCCNCYKMPNHEMIFCDCSRN